MPYPPSVEKPLGSHKPVPGRLKVVPLRPGLLDDDPVPAGRNTVVDLQRPVDSLRSIKSDLEAYYWDQPDDTDRARSRRHQIMFWIRLVGDRTSALEMLVLQKGSWRLRVPGLDPPEQAAIEEATKILDRWIGEDETFPSVQRAMRAILSAADRIGLVGAGGRADGAPTE